MADLYQYGRIKYNNIKNRINHFRNCLTDRADKLIILVYHHILPKVKSNPLNTVVSLKTFIWQIEFLAKRYPVVSLSEAISQCRSGFAKSKTQVVLTFDDGYIDNYELVYSVLKQKGLPASFFIVAGCIDNAVPLWDCEVVKILWNNRTIRRVKIADIIVSQKIMQPRSFFIFSVIDKMKSLTDRERQEVLDVLKEKGMGKNIPEDSNDRCMTWKQIREMSGEAMEIGAHSLSHCSLAALPLNEAIQEIKKSKEAIESNIHKDCLHFAFPFGGYKDFNQELIDYVKEAGFISCLLNIRGYNHIEKDAFCFKRIIMEETTNLRHLAG